MKTMVQEFRLVGVLAYPGGFPRGTVPLEGALPATGPADAQGEFSIRCSATVPARIGVGEGFGLTPQGPATRFSLELETNGAARSGPGNKETA